MSRLLTDELRSKLCHTICFASDGVGDDYNSNSALCQRCSSQKALDEIVSAAVKAVIEEIESLGLVECVNRISDDYDRS